MKSKEVRDILGYESIKEFANSFLGLDHVKINSIFAAIASCFTLVSGYIYDDVTAIYTLVAMYFFDFVTGMVAAWKEKKITSTKIPRVLLNMTLMLGLLSVSWWMSKTSVLFVLMPSIVIGGAYSTLTVSVIENLSRAGALPKQLETVIRKRFGLKILQELDKPTE